MAKQNQLGGKNANHWDVEKKSINSKSFYKGEENFAYPYRNSIDGLITEKFKS